MKITLKYKAFSFLFISGILVINLLGIKFEGWSFIKHFLLYGLIFAIEVFFIGMMASLISTYRDEQRDSSEGMIGLVIIIPIPYSKEIGDWYTKRRKRKQYKTQLADIREDIQKTGYGDPLKLATLLEKEKVIEDLLYDPEKTEKDETD